MFQSQIRKDFRHNFTVNVLDGTFFGLGLGFASSVTVIPLFINSLTDSTTLIGLIASIHMIGWQLPQLLTSNRVAGLSLYRPMVMRMTIHERWPFFGLAVVALLIPLVAPAVALALTFIMLSWHALGGGFTATAWQAMIGKIMPEHRRGTFYGAQSAGLSLLQSIGAVLAGIILARLPYPYNFALCFFLAIVAMLISLYFLWRTREPEGPPVEKRRDWGDFRHNLQVILQRDGNFRWFLLARGLAQVAFMAIGFFTIYGVRNFALGAEAAGFMTGLMLLAQMATSPAVGWIGDRWGHRRVFAGGLLILGLSIFAIMSATDVLWFYLAFALAGIANGVLWTSVLTITVEFGTELERPYYIGLANTLIAPATLLAPIVGGALVDAISFQAMFTLAMGAALLTVVVLLVLIHDPRTRRVPTVAPGD
jgi:MFS family permease